MTVIQSRAEKNNRLLFGKQCISLFSKSKTAATNFSQTETELRIQDGGAHKSQPCWRTAHQPRRRTRIGLTDFNGDTNHARVTHKMSRKNRYLQCPVILNDRIPSGKWPWLRLRDLGSKHDYREAISKHHGTVPNQNKLMTVASPSPLS